MKSASRLKMAATVASVVRASTRPGSPSLPERVQAVPRLVRCTVDRTYAGTTLKRLGLVAGAVAYVASPIDLLPEAVLPVVGAADDVVVISWAITAFFEETDRFLAWEAGRGARRAPDAPRTKAQPFGRTPAGDPRFSGDPGSADLVGEAGLRRDRDATGAAAPLRLLGGASRSPGTGDGPLEGSGATSGPTARSAGTARATGPGRRDRTSLPEGLRQAATDYVLESVRKRLER